MFCFDNVPFPLQTLNPSGILFIKSLGTEKPIVCLLIVFPRVRRSRMFVEMMNLSTSIPKGSHVYRCDTRMTCDPFGVEQCWINISTNIESLRDSFYKNLGTEKSNVYFLLVLLRLRRSRLLIEFLVKRNDPERVACLYL